MTRLACALISAIILITSSSCTAQGGVARDPGKVVQAHPAQAKPYPIFGRLYAVKGGTLYRFSGTTLRALTHQVTVKDPATSADGSELAFAQFGAQDSTIMMTGADLFALRAITPPAGPEGPLWAVEPAFAPDGSGLTYLTDRGKAGGPNDLGIWEYDLRSGQSRRLTIPVAYTGGDSDQTFRPGASPALLFTTYLYDGDPPQPVARLTWMSLRTYRQAYLSPSLERNFQPAVSPDGQFLAYVHAAPTGDELAVTRLPDAPGAPPYPTQAASVIQGGMVAHPVWSPDGRSLAFLRLVNGSFDLYVLPLSIDATGIHAQGAPIALTQGSFFDADSRLSWSP
ncbi:MAG TPA: hypothetical protein VET65_10150 [Candidatus Limnocylindrales bacterium]|nr:hypothetical protein [Candidatus Limnocylindrales bacterium]